MVVLAVSRLMPEPASPMMLAPSIVGHRHHLIAGDAVARALDRAAGVVVDDAPTVALEIDAVVLVSPGEAPLTIAPVIVDHHVDAGADRVGIAPPGAGLSPRW